MVILGIDPGIATVGFGVIAAANGRFGAIEYGAIITKPHQLLETRLCEIHDAVTELIRRHKPDCMAIEELFFNVNVKTAVGVCWRPPSRGWTSTNTRPCRSSSRSSATGGPRSSR